VDRGYTIDATTGTYDIALTAAATLGDGFVFGVYNSGSGTVTINPNASETIRTPSGAATTLALTQGQGVLVMCDGTAFDVVSAVGVGASSPISGLTTGRIVDAASSTTIETAATITTDQSLVLTSGTVQLNAETASRVVTTDGSKQLDTPATVTTAQAWAFSSTLSVIGDNLSITGSTDVTKIAKFEVDGFATITTNVFTLPNASGTVALTDLAQTYSAVQTFTLAPVMTALTASRLTRTNGSKALESNAALTSTRLLFVDGSGWPTDSANHTVASSEIRVGGSTCGMLAGQWPSNANYAYLQNSALAASGGNFCLLQSTTGDTLLNAASGKSIYLGINNTASFTFSPAANVIIGDTVDNGHKVDIVGGTKTTATQFFNVAGTWNSGGTTFSAFRLNITSSASAAASKLMELQLGGTTQFGVQKDGQLFVIGSTGASTASFVATNKPGASTGVGPTTWVKISVGGASYWIPAWAD
jgi:hypothetical protein